MLNANFSYESIIRALKNGVVPQEGFEELIVGRAEEINMFDKELDYVSRGGGSTKFLQGEYGSGKTFLARVIREKAWEKNFVVSWVELGRDVKFNKLENVYFKIVDGMRTCNYRDIPAFEYILQEWLNRLEEKIRYDEELNPLNPDDQQKLNRVMDKEIEKVLQSVGAYSASFTNAIRGYYQAFKNRENDVKNGAVGWLKGEKNIPHQLKKQFNVKGNISKENALNFLNAIVNLIVEIEYAGLVVVIDEAEMIHNITRSDFRNEAYENLRKIVDGTMNNEFNNTFFLFAGTETFFTDEERGIPSYQALSERIASIEKEGFKDLRRPVISLSGFDREQLTEVSYKVRDIHSKVYNWEANKKMTNEVVDNLIDRMMTRFDIEIKTLPREFLKVFIDELDLLQQNPGYNLQDESLDKAVKRVEELSKEEIGESHAI